MGPKKQDLKGSSSKGGNKSSKPIKKPIKKVKENDSDEDKDEDSDDDEDEDDGKSKRNSINKRKRVVEEENDEEDEEDGSENDSDNESNDDNDSNEDEEDEEEEEPPKKLSKGASDKKVVTKKADKPAKKDDKASAKKKADKKKADKKKADKKKANASGSKASDSKDKDGLPKAGKKLSKIERLEEARKAFKWWEAPELEEGANWKKLEHAGIAFAPPYVRHNIPMKYDGQILLLTMEQEEMASSYANLPHDGPQLGIPKTRVVFQKNFFKDFQELFPAGNIMKKFDKCDFSVIKEHLDLHKSLKKAATVEEKAVLKGQKDVLALQHGFCLIDGRTERVSYTLS
jgi:DNA topoisomerase-1